MRHFILTFFILAIGISISGQGKYSVVDDRQLISTSGDVSTTIDQSYSIDFAIGEPVVESFSNSYFMLSQGFCQGEFVSYNENSKFLPSKIFIFPNPSTGLFNVQIREEYDDDYNVVIFNIIGEKVYEGSFASNYIKLDLYFLAQGKFFIRVEKKNGDVVGFSDLTIIKT